jgi:hypothetical protein
MEPEAPRFTGLPKDWGEVLDRVQQALTQAVTETTERERTLQLTPQAETGTERTERWQQQLAQLDEHLRALQACAQRAAENAAQTDAALASSEETLCRWLTSKDDQVTR